MPDKEELELSFGKVTVSIQSGNATDVTRSKWLMGVKRSVGFHGSSHVLWHGGTITELSVGTPTGPSRQDGARKSRCPKGTW